MAMTHSAHATLLSLTTLALSLPAASLAALVDSSTQINPGWVVRAAVCKANVGYQ